MTITAVVGGGGGGPFSTMAAFISYMSGRTLSQNEEWAASGTTTDTAFCDLNQANWTPAGFTLTLRAAAGEGVSAGGRAWWLTSGRAILTNSVTGDSGYRFKGPLVIVRDLQLETSSSSANYTAVVSDGALMERCIARNNATFAVVIDGSGAAGVVRSCLLINRQSGGSGVTMSGGGIDLVRCTVVGNGGGGTGFNSSVYTVGKARGCIVYGFGTDFVNTSLAGSTNNATDKSSFGGTGFGSAGQVSILSADFISVGSGTEDYTPAVASTKLLETGAIISGATVDLFGTALPQGAINDIGAVEAPASLDPSLLAAQGSFAITGQAASLTFGRTLLANQGSYASTGQDATLLYGQPGVYTLAAAFGSYIVTGSDGLAQRAMNAESGSYLLAGQGATFVITQPLAYPMLAEFGTYLLTGRRANLLAPGDLPTLGDGDKMVKLALMGYTGSLNNMLLRYYQDNGATSSILNTAEMEFLAAQGAVATTLNQRRRQFYVSLGYNGSLNDMEYAYWWEL